MENLRRMSPFFAITGMSLDDLIEEVMHEDEFEKREKSKRIRNEFLDKKKKYNKRGKRHGR